MNIIKKTCKFYLKVPIDVLGQFGDELVCFNEVWQDSDYCVLHTDFPEDKNSPDYNALFDEKSKIIKEKTQAGELEFIGAILPDINFKNMKLSDISSWYSTIRGNTIFTGATISDLIFIGNNIEGNVLFDGATIEGLAIFGDTIIKGNIDFTGATIDYFDDEYGNATVEGNAFFNDSKEMDAFLEVAEVKGKIFSNLEK